MTGHAPVDPALVERFRRDFIGVLGRALDPAERIALAVSGGPDSMAMLVLAAAAYPDQVVAATVDHRLRATAADEARMVAAYCDSIGVPHATLTVTDRIGPSGVQAKAREHRYGLLLRWAKEAGAQCLATAHHAEDQAETFLMRAARGSGVAGLAGIRARQTLEGMTVIRPLLGWRVADLRALVEATQAPFVDDPSNADLHYERSRFRALLRETPLLDAAQIARSAAYVAEADATLREIEQWLWQSRKVVSAEIESPSAPCRLDIADLPREVKRRMCRSAIAAVRTSHDIVRPAFDDATNIEPLLDALESGKSATQAGVMVSVKGTVWRFAEQPPRRTLPPAK